MLGDETYFFTCLVSDTVENIKFNLQKQILIPQENLSDDVIKIVLNDDTILHNSETLINILKRTSDLEEDKLNEKLYSQKGIEELWAEFSANNYLKLFYPWTSATICITALLSERVFIINNIDSHFTIEIVKKKNYERSQRHFICESEIIFSR